MTVERRAGVVVVEVRVNGGALRGGKRGPGEGQQGGKRRERPEKTRGAARGKDVYRRLLGVDRWFQYTRRRCDFRRRQRVDSRPTRVLYYPVIFYKKQQGA